MSFPCSKCYLKLLFEIYLKIEIEKFFFSPCWPVASFPARQPKPAWPSLRARPRVRARAPPRQPRPTPLLRGPGPRRTRLSLPRADAPSNRAQAPRDAWRPHAGDASRVAPDSPHACALSTVLAPSPLHSSSSLTTLGRRRKSSPSSSPLGSGAPVRRRRATTTRSTVSTTPPAAATPSPPLPRADRPQVGSHFRFPLPSAMDGPRRSWAVTVAGPIVSISTPRVRLNSTA
jgi:hypothetical protein